MPELTRHFGLRSRATGVATLLCALVLVGGSVSLVGTLDRQLTSSRDDLSRSRVRDLIDQAAAGQLPAVLRNVNDDSVAQVFTEDGRVVSASANIQGRPPIVSVPTGANGEARTIRAPDDAEIETYRVWVETGRGPDGSLTVVEGTSLESVQEATSTLRRSLMVGVPLALLALCVVIWLVLGRALARLDRIRAEVDALGHDQLDRRLPDDGRRDEVGRLVTTMNRMLSRVDSSVQRQRRFVADVSHDLQGPLTAQRLSLELVLASPEPVDKAILRDDVLGATGQMERLVGDLLVLASVDEGAVPRWFPWTSTRSCSRKRRGRPAPRPWSSAPPTCRPVQSTATPVSCAGSCGTCSTTRSYMRGRAWSSACICQTDRSLSMSWTTAQAFPERAGAHLPTVPPRGPCANAGHGGHRSWALDREEPGAKRRRNGRGRRRPGAGSGLQADPSSLVATGTCPAISPGGTGAARCVRPPAPGRTPERRPRPAHRT